VELRTAFIVALDDIRPEDLAPGSLTDQLIDWRGPTEVCLLAVEEGERWDFGEQDLGVRNHLIRLSTVSIRMRLVATCVRVRRS
jgi:hypothetical protein